MKLIIAGSRTINKYRAAILFLTETTTDKFSQWYINTTDTTRLVMGGLNELFLFEAVTGTAKGVDQVPIILENFFKEVHKMPADWDTHGRAAGPIRNRQMAEVADALFLIWDGQSRGSANMKKEMERLNKPIYEMIVVGD